MAGVGCAVFVVVVVLRFAFAVLRFAAVNVVVEIHMPRLVGPFHN